MPVDKFGRTDTTNPTRVISGGITLSQANNAFLRRDGDNAAVADINLDLNKLINVADPANNKDATNKEYVDNKRNLVGYIPILESNNSCTGFITIASSSQSDNHQPHGAFNHMNREGDNGSWATSAGNTTGWLQIKCPQPVRIWKVALKARKSSTRAITAWNLSASNNGTDFIALHSSTLLLEGSATEPTFISFKPSEVGLYRYYRLTITASAVDNVPISRGSASGASDLGWGIITPNVGVQLMQLYVYNS